MVNIVLKQISLKNVEIIEQGKESKYILYQRVKKDGSKVTRRIYKSAVERVESITNN